MSSFAEGLLSAYGERSHEQNLLDLQGEIDRRKSLANWLQKLALDPTIHQEHRDELLNRVHTILSTPYSTKLPSGIADLGKMPLKPGASLKEAPTGTTPLVPPIPAGPAPVNAPVNAPPPSDLDKLTPEQEKIGQPPEIQAGPRPGIDLQVPAPVPIPPPPQGMFMSAGELGQKAAEMQGPVAEASLRQKMEEYRATTKAEIERKKEEAAAFAAMTPEERKAYLESQGKTTPRPTRMQQRVLGAQLMKTNPDIRTLSGEALEPTQRYDTFQPPGAEMYASPSGSTGAPVKVWSRDKSSETGWKLELHDPNTGDIISSVSNVVPRPEFSRVSTREAIVEQADGTKKVVPLTTVSGVVIGGGGGTAPGSTAPKSAPLPESTGRTVGERAMTPIQKERLEEQSVALGTTIDLVQRVQKNVDVLGSLIDAGKIKLATDPTSSHLIISRLMPLKGKEIELAADMQNLAEHINTLRGPLGATGFRSLESWIALQANRGNLLSQPEITKRVLQTTLQSLNKIKAAKDKYLNPSNFSVNYPKEAKPPGQVESISQAEIDAIARNNKMPSARIKQIYESKGYVIK